MVILITGSEILTYLIKYFIEDSSMGFIEFNCFLDSLSNLVAISICLLVVSGLSRILPKQICCSGVEGGVNDLPKFD